MRPNNKIQAATSQSRIFQKSYLPIFQQLPRFFGRALEWRPLNFKYERATPKRQSASAYAHFALIAHSLAPQNRLSFANRPPPISFGKKRLFFALPDTRPPKPSFGFLAQASWRAAISSRKTRSFFAQTCHFVPQNTPNLRLSWGVH